MGNCWMCGSPFKKYLPTWRGRATRRCGMVPPRSCHGMHDIVLLLRGRGKVEAGCECNRLGQGGAGFAGSTGIGGRGGMEHMAHAQSVIARGLLQMLPLMRSTLLVLHSCCLHVGACIWVGGVAVAYAPLLGR